MEITTADKYTKEQEEAARTLAKQVNCRFVPRKKALFENTTLVCGTNSFVLYSRHKKDKLFFHPSLARSRIRQFDRDGGDTLIQAMDLKMGHHVLDCNLGLATDALVASHVVGKSGRITGLESVKPIAETIRLGMRVYSEDDWIPWQEIFSRIEVINTSYKTYLPTLGDNSIDVVYFDPMFETPIESSPSIAPLRIWANFEFPDQKDIRQALRVARKRVVMKSYRDDTRLTELGFYRLESTKKICFGCIDAERD